MEPLEAPWPMVRVAPAPAIVCDARCTPAQRLEMGPGWGGVVLWERDDPSPAPGPELNVYRFVRVDTPSGGHDLEIGVSGTLCGGDALFRLDHRVTFLRAEDVVPGGPLELVIETAWSSSATRGTQLRVCATQPDGGLACASFQPSREPGYHPPDGTRFSDPQWVRGRAVTAPGGARWTPADPAGRPMFFRLTGP